MRRAMILAAGRGERMGSLTAFLPKSLLHVRGKYLIEYAIDSLKQADINEIVINVSYRANQIQTVLGDGSHYGVKIIYSHENERLETGGGILKALPLLGEKPFIVISSDIITDYSLANLPENPQGLAHLVMVNNPHYHLHGDYELKNGCVALDGNEKLTYANIGVFKPALFANCQLEHFRLTKVLNPAIRSGEVTGEHYHGEWHNIGTPKDIEIIT